MEFGRKLTRSGWCRSRHAVPSVCWRSLARRCPMFIYMKICATRHSQPASVWVRWNRSAGRAGERVDDCWIPRLRQSSVRSRDRYDHRRQSATLSSTLYYLSGPVSEEVSPVSSVHTCSVLRGSPPPSLQHGSLDVVQHPSSGLAATLRTTGWFQRWRTASLRLPARRMESRRTATTDDAASGFVHARRLWYPTTEWDPAPPTLLARVCDGDLFTSAIVIGH